MLEPPPERHEVLIIDPDLSIAQYAALILEAAGYSVTIRMSCADVEARCTSQPEVAVIEVQSFGERLEALPLWLAHYLPTAGVLLLSSHAELPPTPLPEWIRRLPAEMPLTAEKLVACVAASRTRASNSSAPKGLGM
jgi:DNA-binding NtrC family response regulator